MAEPVGKKIDADCAVKGPGPLAPVVLPETCNYIGVFLTLDCNLTCSYCINRFNGPVSAERMMSGAQWLAGLNRLSIRPDLPITLQGGEPTLHPDFFEIVRGVSPELPLDLLTNLETDLDRFTAEIKPSRLWREAPYASIRVSFHPESMQIETLASRVSRLQAAGYHIGIWGVSHPKWREQIARAADYCSGLGIDFRTKEFLGEFEGTFYGNLAYPDACDGQEHPLVECRTSELLVGPGGDVYRCHADLYRDRNAIGHLLDPRFDVAEISRPCSHYGDCNPCDVKLKTNRFQEFGHTSVEITPCT
jgi:sulfatase maturation enzyme AslB (radical SAM superfamily)